MYQTDIVSAISRKTMSEVRDAFLALAIRGWDSITTPMGNEISDRAKRKLLREVCELLSDDDNVMPGDACDRFDLPPGSTYGRAAAHALLLAGGQA